MKNRAVIVVVIVVLVGLGWALSGELTGRGGGGGGDRRGTDSTGADSRRDTGTTGESADRRLVFVAPFCQAADETRADTEELDCFPNPVLLETETPGSGELLLTPEFAGPACEDLARQNGLLSDTPAAFDIWYGAGDSSPAERFEWWLGTYVLPSGEPVAEGWDDITDGTLLHPIDEDASGFVLALPIVSATLPDGSVPPECRSRGRRESSASYGIGDSSSAESDWSAPGDFDCMPTDGPFWDPEAAVYCVQQTGDSPIKTVERTDSVELANNSSSNRVAQNRTANNESGGERMARVSDASGPDDGQRPQDENRPGDRPIPVPRDSVKPTAAVGALPGTASVSGAGQFLYHIPLVTPAGRAGMQPNLALAYNSEGRNGPLGVGWHLSGLSAISRCARTLSSDGVVEGIRLDGGGKYCLDGEKLVPVPIQPLGGGLAAPRVPNPLCGGSQEMELIGEYRTEHESFARILAFSPAPGATTIAADEPLVWMVLRKNGQIDYYGEAGNPSQPGHLTATHERGIVFDKGEAEGTRAATLAWLLSRQVDRRGNAVRYDYRHDASHSITRLPETIRYTQSPHRQYANSAERRVEFVYEDRPDPTDAWVSGLNRQLKERLVRVDMYAPNPSQVEVVRSYRLKYAPSFRTARSLMVEASVCDGEGACLPATTFEYAQPSWAEEGGAPVRYERIDIDLPALASVTEIQSKVALLVGDVNRDGYDDLIYNLSNAEGNPPWLSLSKGNLSPSHANSFLSWSYPTASPLKNLGMGSYYRHSAVDNASRLLDHDGDGSLDWLACADFDGPEGKGCQILTWDRPKSHFVQTGIGWWQEAFGYGWDAVEEYKSSYVVADVDGDRLPDVATRTKNYGGKKPSGYSWQVWTNDGPGFTKLPTWVALGPMPSGDSLTVFDAYGDGTAEVLDDTSLAGMIPSGWTVDKTFTNPSDPERPSSSDILADVNGDGLKDFIRPTGKSYPHINLLGEFEVSINTGNGIRPAYSEPVIYAQGQSPGQPSGGGYYSGPPISSHFRVGDFNGDGRDDLLWFDLPYNHAMEAGAPWDFITARWYPRVFLSNGRTFDEIPVSTFQARRWTAPSLGDLDNDGKPEILMFTMRQGGGLQLTVVAQPEEPDVERFYDRIVTVVDGMGATTRVKYSPHSAGGKGDPVYAAADGCSYPVQCAAKGAVLVHEVRYEQPNTFDGGNVVSLPDRVLEYRYRGAHVDLRGRGWLGFEETIEDDLTTGVRTVTEYDFSRTETPGGLAVYPGAGRPSRRVTKTPLATGSREEVIDYAYNLRFLGSPEERYRVDLTKKHALTFENSNIPAREVTTTFTWDGWSNLLATERKVSGGFTDAMMTTYENREQSWLIGLPVESVSTSTTNSNVSAARTTHVLFDGAGLRKEMILEPDAPTDPDLWLSVVFQRDAGGVLTNVTMKDLKGRSRTFAMEPDADGVFPTTFTNPLGQTETMVFHPGIERQVLHVDANGALTKSTFDGLGRPRGVQSPDGMAVEIGYGYGTGDSSARLRVSRNFSTGFYENEFVDSWMRPTILDYSAFDGNVVRTTIGYDAAGRAFSFQDAADPHDPNPPVRYLAYDNLGRVTRVLHADQTEEKFTWNGFTGGLYETVLHDDPVGRHSVVRLDLDGRVLQTMRMEGSQISSQAIQYGPFGQVDTITDHGGNQVNVDYDRRGRRRLLDDPNKTLLWDTHDAFGDLYAQKDGAGNVRNFTYDALGRMVQRDSEDGTDLFTWDAGVGGIGRLSSASSVDGVSQQFEYDAIGRPVKQRHALGQDVLEMELSWDALGRPSAVRYPETVPGTRLVTRNEYNQWGYLAKIDDLTNGQSLLEVLERDPETRLTRDRRGGVLETTWLRDIRGRVTSLSTGNVPAATTPIQFDYTYNGDGRLASRKDLVMGTTERFSYDGVARMFAWQFSGNKGNRSRTYDFDSAGRMKSISDTGPNMPGVQTMQYTYPTTGQKFAHAAVQVGTNTYQYDNAGRRISREVKGVPNQTIEYGWHDLATKVTADETDFTILYDAFGSRFRTEEGDRAVTYFGQLYERHDTSSGREHVHNVPGPTGTVARLKVRGSQPAVFETEFLIQERQGSTTLVTDTQGVVVDRLFYEPYGQRIDLDGVPLEATGSTVETSVGFTGHEHDDEFGFINMRGRLYDPATRRFVSPDPYIGRAMQGIGVDRYRYVAYDPMNLTDPSGFFGCEGCDVVFDDDPLYGDVPEPDQSSGVDGWAGAGDADGGYSGGGYGGSYPDGGNWGGGYGGGGDPQSGSYPGEVGDGPLPPGGIPLGGAAFSATSSSATGSGGGAKKPGGGAGGGGKKPGGAGPVLGVIGVSASVAEAHFTSVAGKVPHGSLQGAAQQVAQQAAQGARVMAGAGTLLGVVVVVNDVSSYGSTKPGLERDMAGIGITAGSLSLVGGAASTVGGSAAATTLAGAGPIGLAIGTVGAVAYGTTYGMLEWAFGPVPGY